MSSHPALRVLLLPVLAALLHAQPQPLARPGVTFQIFQFPADQIPEWTATRMTGQWCRRAT